MDTDKRHNYTQNRHNTTGKLTKRICTSVDCIYMLTNLGHKIIFDPRGDGTCQFNAIGYFFRLSGFDCSNGLSPRRSSSLSENTEEK